MIHPLFALKKDFIELSVFIPNCIESLLKIFPEGKKLCQKNIKVNQNWYTFMQCLPPNIPFKLSKIKFKPDTLIRLHLENSFISSSNGKFYFISQQIIFTWPYHKLYFSLKDIIVVVDGVVSLMSCMFKVK